MGFSIDYGGSGLFGALLIGALVIVGVVVLIVFLRTVKIAQDDVVDDEHDHKEDGPIA